MKDISKLNRLIGLDVSEEVRDAVTAFLVPQKIAPNEQEVALLQLADSVQIHGEQRLMTWHWQPRASASNGHKALLVHGWNSRGSHMGAFVRPLLDTGFEVWTFDAHAHGDSAGEYSSVVHHAHSINLVARQMGTVEAVIAHSVGSPATLLACSRGLTPVASVHLSGPSSLRRVALGAALMTGLPMEEQGSYLSAIEQVAGLPLEFVQPPQLTSDQRHRGLLLHDREDREIPFSDSEEIASFWPNAELQEVSGVGHRRIVRDPCVIERAVDFLRNHTMGSQPREKANL